MRQIRMLLCEERTYSFQKLQIKKVKKREDSLNLRYNKESTFRSYKILIININYA